MNKALHVLVYVFLVLAGAALFFEVQLNAKRNELTDRNRMQEDYLVRIAKTVESKEAKANTIELQKDVSPVEAKDLADLDRQKDDVLDGYPAQLEQQEGLETFDWDPQNVREQLRRVYALDSEGNPIMDGNKPLDHGPGTEDELLSKLLEACKKQQSRLNDTRAELVKLREKLTSAIEELNDLKPKARKDKVLIEELKAKIAKLESEKTELENQITKQKSQIDELNAEITSLKDEVQTAKDETETAKEEIEKLKKMNDKLNKLLQEALLTQGQKGEKSTITSLPAGDKGKLIHVDNENMFAIVAFSDDAMKELKGDDLHSPIPHIELGLRRKGYNGTAGEFVGRIRIRQEIKGKTYVICDILSSWEQDPAQVNDIVFAD